VPSAPAKRAKVPARKRGVQGGNPKTSRQYLERVDLNLHPGRSLMWWTVLALVSLRPDDIGFEGYLRKALPGVECNHATVRSQLRKLLEQGLVGSYEPPGARRRCRGYRMTEEGLELLIEGAQQVSAVAAIMSRAVAEHVKGQREEAS
jgi:DNA-binding HxlR family transcriptional regulator